MCAVIVAGPAQPPALRELRAFLMERGLASFKLPDRIVPVDELPLTAIGKVDKRALVARLTAARG
jgi:non-ribosomal peptide synthetase component E (peptide arylation enzyme)